MKKKIMALLLACTLAAGMTVCPVGPAGMETVWADDSETKTWGNWKYVEDGSGGVIIVWDGSEMVNQITIPDEINGMPVTGLGERAFAGIFFIV